MQPLASLALAGAVEQLGRALEVGQARAWRARAAGGASSTQSRSSSCSQAARSWSSLFWLGSGAAGAAGAAGFSATAVSALGRRDRLRLAARRRGLATAAACRRTAAARSGALHAFFASANLRAEGACCPARDARLPWGHRLRWITPTTVFASTFPGLSIGTRSRILASSSMPRWPSPASEDDDTTEFATYRDNVSGVHTSQTSPAPYIEELERTSRLVGSIPLDEITTDFQPIVNLLSGETEGYEALARCGGEGLTQPSDLYARAALEKKVGELGRAIRAIAVRECAGKPAVPAAAPERAARPLHRPARRPDLQPRRPALPRAHPADALGYGAAGDPRARAAAARSRWSSTTSASGRRRSSS